jgi:arsenate reductase
MAMIKIYHNPRCKKSRAGLAALEAKAAAFEVVDYLKDPLSEQALDALIKMTGLDVEKLVRKQEDHYKQQLKGKKLSHAEWVKEIAANPKLLQRPIVVKGNKAVLADPPENMDGIF